MPGVLANFERGELLGRGGMGEVLRVRHRPTGVWLALKLLTASPSHDPRTFLRELRAISQLDHPHVLRVIDGGLSTEDDEGWPPDRPWICTELARGGTLLGLLPAMDWPTMADTLRQLLGALAHAHARGVLHFDVKPANVLVDWTSTRALHLRLTDFGLAAARASSVVGPHTSGSHAMGTPAYLPPERIEGATQDLGPWTDLYALGCVAFHLAQGSAPFTGNSNFAVLEHQLRSPLPTLAPRFATPPGLEAWIRKATEKDPTQRWRSAAEALAQLRALDPAAFARPAPTPWPSPAPRQHLVGLGLGSVVHRVAPVVGRRAEQAHLWSAVERSVARQRTQVVELHGDPGLGSTRLARCTAEEASERLGAAVFVVAPLPHEAAGPPSHPSASSPPGSAGSQVTPFEFAPLAAAVQGAPRSSPQRIERAWALLGGSPDLARRLCRVSDAPDPSEVADVWLALQDLSGRRPVVLVLDRVGTTVATWARALSGEVGAVTVVLRAGGEPGAGSLRLEPLADAHIATLVDALLGVDEAVRHHVVAHSRGNPGFAVALLQDLVRTHRLVEGPQGLRFTEGAPLAAPGDLHALWKERLGALRATWSDSERRVLQLAALAGHLDPAERWRAAPQDEVRRVTGALLDLGWARATDQGGARFCEPGLLTTLREDLDPQILPSLHSALADQMDGQVPEQAEHLFAAGRWREAAPALMTAFRAVARFRPPAAALLLLDKVKQAVDQLDSDPLNPLRLEILAHRAALAGGADRTVGQAALAEARAYLPEQVEALPELLLPWGTLEARFGSGARALRLVQRARRNPALAPRRDLQLYLGHLQSELYAERGRITEALRHLDGLLPGAHEPAPDDPVLQRALLATRGYRGLFRLSQDPAAALVDLEASASLDAARIDPRYATLALAGAALAHHALGDPQISLQAVARARELRTQLGGNTVVAGDLLLGLLHLVRGDADEAEVEAARLLARVPGRPERQRVAILALHAASVRQPGPREHAELLEVAAWTEGSRSWHPGVLGACASLLASAPVRPAADAPLLQRAERIVALHRVRYASRNPGRPLCVYGRPPPGR